MGRAFALAWIGSALWVGGWYHWELDRRNAAYDYPRVHAEALRLLPRSPVVAAWGIYELPVSFYFDRRVVSVASDRRSAPRHGRASGLERRAEPAPRSPRSRIAEGCACCPSIGSITTRSCW